MVNLKDSWGRDQGNRWGSRWGSTFCGSEQELFVSMYVLRCFSCVQLFVTPWTVAHQAPLSKEFSRQEYRNGLPFPTPWIELSPDISAKNRGQVRWGKCRRALRSKFILDPLVSSGPRKCLFIQHLLFHLYVNCPPSLWSSKTLPQHSSSLPWTKYGI